MTAEEFLDSVHRINVAMQPRATQERISWFFFAGCIIAAIICVIIGAATLNRDTVDEQFPRLFLTALILVFASAILFTLLQWYIRIRFTETIKRAIARENSLYANRHPSCSWRLEDEIIPSTYYRRRISNHFQIVIDLSGPIAPVAMAFGTPFTDPNITLQAHPVNSSFAVPASYNMQPQPHLDPYNTTVQTGFYTTAQLISGYCGSCGKALSRHEYLCAQCGAKTNI